MRSFFLALLARGPVHGYVLKQRHDELFGPPWPPINIGQIYVTMGRLERDGLVSMHVDGDRKLYELTELGEKELNHWIDVPETTVSAKSDMLLRLVAASLVPGANVGQVLSEARQRLIGELRELDNALASAATPNELSQLLAQQAGLHLQADLKWLDIAETVLMKRTSRNKPRTAAS
jgi:DNA-binding PadR family transcriptional regulator